MRKWILLFAILIGVTSVARAADDAGSAQAVISSQVDAIGRGDAAAAYSYAAPGIQGLFPKAELFMAIVRQGYAPLYRPKTFEFGKAVSADRKIAQQVHITDSEGAGWEALYTLEQQPDGSLKITGCSLVKADQGA